jgi:predicted AlkP superfamily pyrophosphatase or phosphodiesterase
MAVHPTSQKTVIFLSIDGFRNDYLEYAPNLAKLAAEGIKADFMDPVFPVSIPESSAPRF